jgi:hypothetical protein
VELLSFDAYVVVPPPLGGFWRVSNWSEPLEPRPAPLPLGSCSPAEDDSGRFDDPQGEFRTLYCATDPDGAVGECLGEFVYSAATAVKIEGFLESEPDPGFDEGYHRPLDASDIDGFGWTLAHAPAELVTRLIDVDDKKTYLACAPRALKALAKLGVRRFDRATLLDARRHVTRTMAGIWRSDATDDESGELLAAGLRYTSRLPPAWECWALWEPLPLDHDAAEYEPVTIDSRALRKAADLLGVALAP